MIVEEVSGQPFGKCVEEQIFAPLGMESSFVARGAAEEAWLALSGVLTLIEAGAKVRWALAQPGRAT